MNWFVIALTILTQSANGEDGSLTSFICDDLSTICSDQTTVSNVDELCGDDVGFKSPTTCNCDALCLQSIAENDPCILSFTYGRSDSICGFGLDCLPKNPDDPTSYDYTCQKDIEKDCVNKSVEYSLAVQSGTLGPGESQANCDEYGRYAGKQCTPAQTCYCVDAVGQRIFGEAYVLNSENMTCACSLLWEEMRNLGMESGPRCLPDGNFDALQCLEDNCYCYNATSKALDYGPYIFDMKQYLICYDSDIHNSNYLNSCEMDLNEHLTIANDEQTIIIGDSYLPKCSADGYYEPLQQRGTKMLCVDLEGYKIESFEWLVIERQNSSCLCARRRNLMRNAGVENDLPDCCPNGNFNPIQTRGLYSYCVDSNGNQVGKEQLQSDQNNLLCDLPNCI